jgi:hypothetical protein
LDIVFLFLLTFYLNSVYERGRYFVVWYFIAEETAFTDLLKYMYSGTLRAHSTKELLDLLMVADKFQVTSFVDWCISVLLNLPMSTDCPALYGPAQCFDAVIDRYGKEVSFGTIW